jgi:cytochrome P450
VPADDMLSRLIQRAEQSGQPTTIPELVSVGVSLLVAGHETTANTIALSVTALLRNPDQLKFPDPLKEHKGPTTARANSGN